MFLFVYGTLKRNSENHGMLKKAKFISKAFIHGYLYDLGVGIPAVAIENTRDKVYGEIFEADDDLLDELDEFEGFNPESEEDSVYSRIEAEAFTDNREVYKVQTYVMNERQLSRFFAIPLKKDHWQ